MSAMRPEGRRILGWGALMALALLAFSGVPHLHHEVEDEEEHCVLCHAQDAPSAASGVPANRAPVVRSAVLPVRVTRVEETTAAGGGSRAPPA